MNKALVKKTAESSPPDLRRINVSEFGKDHWSTLTYLETRCVDHKGRIDIRNMRCNSERHPGQAHIPIERENGKFKYPTALRDGKFEPEHDDWDCIDDLEAAGFLKTFGTGIHPEVGLTDEGWAVAGRLRRHRGAGGQFADFVL